MKVLLDECLPRKLAAALEEHTVYTVAQAGFRGLKNGALLAKIDGVFEAFITSDANLPHQQALSTRKFVTIVLKAPSNALEDLLPLVPEILAALEAKRPGRVVVLQA